MGQIFGRMRTNGTLRYEILINGGVNEYGEPVPARSEWSEPIDCSIKTNSDNRIGRYEDGVFRMASFTIMIELAKFPYNSIKLERLGEYLGEYKILNAEPLTSVGRTKITV